MFGPNLMHSAHAHWEVSHAQQVVDGVANHLAEDGVLLVQPICLVKGDEELGAIAVGTVLVGTRQQASERHTTH